MKTMHPPDYVLCTSAHDVRLHISGTNEPKSAQVSQQGAQCKWS